MQPIAYGRLTLPAGTHGPTSGVFARGPVRTAVESLLRGVSQVDLMSSAACGVFFVAALFASGWQFGLAGLLGTTVSTLTAVALGVATNRVTAGLEGFNGCLVAVSFLFYLGRDKLSTWLLIIAGAVAVSVVTGALVTYLGTWHVPTFTLPFCLVATGMVVAAPGWQRIWHGRARTAELPKPGAGATSLNWTDLWHAFFANVSQVFFRPQWYVGVLFLAGLFVASRTAGLMACLGSVIGILTGWLLGAPNTHVAEGLLGYNSVLAAIALGGVLVALGLAGVVYAVVGAVVAAGLTATLTAFFRPVGAHTFTWPYVLTALVFVAAVPSFHRLRRT